MADFTQVTETIQRRTYRLTCPTNATELDKMVHAAARDFARENGMETKDVPDDVLQVATRNNEIEIWWEVQLRGEESRGCGCA